MFLSLPLLAAVSAMIINVSADQITMDSAPTLMRRTGTKTALYPHLQVTKRDLHANSHDQPTATASVPSQQGTASLQRRAEPSSRRNNSFLIRTKVYGYLNDLLIGIKIRHRNIKRISAQKVTRANAQSIGWKILAELRAILAVCLACAAKLRAGGTSPRPSAVPGGPPPPPLIDICQIIFKITLEIKALFLLLAKLCSQQVIIKRICEDCLRQITRALSDCFISAGEQIRGLLAGVLQLYGGNLSAFFNPVGFGFKAIAQVFLRHR